MESGVLPFLWDFYNENKKSSGIKSAKIREKDGSLFDSEIETEGRKGSEIQITLAFLSVLLLCSFLVLGIERYFREVSARCRRMWRKCFVSSKRGNYEREKSNGKRGVLDLMQKLSNEYGPTKPFNDNELFAKITSLTYPDVGTFLETYVSGPTPIPYDTYLSKVGITKSIKKVPTNVFLKGQLPYITVDQQTKEIIVIPNIELNDFYKNLGLKGGDILMSINEKPYSLDNIYEMISESQNWKENDAISIKIKRNGKEQVIKGKIKLPYEEKEGLKATDQTKNALKEAWQKA